MSAPETPVRRLRAWAVENARPLAGAVLGGLLVAVMLDRRAGLIAGLALLLAVVIGVKVNPWLRRLVQRAKRWYLTRS